VFLQRGSATNDRIGSAKAGRLKFSQTICARCNDTLTQPYDHAWEQLSAHLHSRWVEIVRIGLFDLTRAFPGRTRAAALDVHLFFVKLFGCKLREDNISVPLDGFSHALCNRAPHPEVMLQIVDTSNKYAHLLAARDTPVYTMRNEANQQLDGATWLYEIPPVGVKVHYIRSGTPLIVRGHSWHPNRPSKIVHLSPIKGATEPRAGPKALR